MAFLLKARRMLGDAQPARIDHELLLTALAAARGEAGSLADESDGEEALVEILLGGAGWRRAAKRRGGCFNRAEAGRRARRL